MSSKLHRGGVPLEHISWNKVPPEPGQIDSYPSAAYPATAEPVTHSATFSDDPAQLAYQEGFQQGQAAARQEMVAQMEALCCRVARSIEEISGLKHRFRHEAEQDLVALSIAIARRILHRELTVAPEALLGLVKAALEKIELREVHRVRASREDAPLIERYLEKIGPPQRVEVSADAALARGTVLFDSTHGMLDASVETQLAEIERGFADVTRRTI